MFWKHALAGGWIAHADATSTPPGEGPEAPMSGLHGLLAGEKRPKSVETGPSGQNLCCGETSPSGNKAAGFQAADEHLCRRVENGSQMNNIADIKQDHSFDRAGGGGQFRAQQPVRPSIQGGS